MDDKDTDDADYNILTSKAVSTLKDSQRKTAYRLRDTIPKTYTETSKSKIILVATDFVYLALSYTRVMGASQQSVISYTL